MVECGLSIFMFNRMLKCVLSLDGTQLFVSTNRFAWSLLESYALKYKVM